jgi:4-hydroxybenzoate polyprenyltransferase
LSHLSLAQHDCPVPIAQPEGPAPAPPHGIYKLFRKKFFSKNIFCLNFFLKSLAAALLGSNLGVGLGTGVVGFIGVNLSRIAGFLAPS